MNIEPLDHQTIKIILSANDMKEYNISYDEMDYNNPTTRKVIIQLLQQVRTQTSIDFSHNKLFIEAFPAQEGGCVLYLNLLGAPAKSTNHKGGFHTPLIFLIDNLEELRRLCNKLYHSYNHLILKSSLYETDESYILMIYSYYKLDARLIAIIREYGSFLGKGELKSQLIGEHATQIVKDKAVEMIHQYIS